MNQPKIIYIDGKMIGEQHDFFSRLYFDDWSSIIKVRTSNTPPNVFIPVKFYSPSPNAIGFDNLMPEMKVSKGSIIYVNSDGFVHRENGPAVITYGTKHYYHKGRDKGRVYKKPIPEYKEWIEQLYPHLPTRQSVIMLDDQA
jgi:hypothetical protein